MRHEDGQKTRICRLRVTHRNEDHFEWRRSACGQTSGVRLLACAVSYGRNGCIPVHDTGKLSHCVGFPKVNVKFVAWTVEKICRRSMVGKGARPRRGCMRAAEVV